MILACAQYSIRDGDKQHNLESSLSFIRRAAGEGADLVVLPELANTGCGLASRQSALGLSEPIPDGETVQAWTALAGELGIYIVGGVLEREGDTLYNSAVLAGPDSFGRYRKTHLWDSEKLTYKPGRDLPVFQTPLGRIGMLICYDAWFAEAARTLALHAADIICVPSSTPDDWVPDAQRRGGLTMLNIHSIAHANANRIFVAAANRVGDGYQGRSCIVDSTGGVLAFGSVFEEELVSFELDPGRVPDAKQLTELSHAFGDRNSTVYKLTEG